MLSSKHRRQDHHAVRPMQDVWALPCHLYAVKRNLWASTVTFFLSLPDLHLQISHNSLIKSSDQFLSREQLMANNIVLLHRCDICYVDFYNSDHNAL